METLPQCLYHVSDYEQPLADGGLFWDGNTDCVANVGKGQRLDGPLCCLRLVTFPVNIIALMLRTLPSAWVVLINILSFLGGEFWNWLHVLLPFSSHWTVCPTLDWLARGWVSRHLGDLYLCSPAASSPSSLLAAIIFVCILLSLGCGSRGPGVSLPARVEPGAATTGQVGLLWPGKHGERLHGVAGHLSAWQSPDCNCSCNRSDRRSDFFRPCSTWWNTL